MESLPGLLKPGSLLHLAWALYTSRVSDDDTHESGLSEIERQGGWSPRRICHTLFLGQQSWARRVEAAGVLDSERAALQWALAEHAECESLVLGLEAVREREGRMARLLGCVLGEHGALRLCRRLWDEWEHGWDLTPRRQEGERDRDPEDAELKARKLVSPPLRTRLVLGGNWSVRTACRP